MRVGQPLVTGGTLRSPGLDWPEGLIFCFDEQRGMTFKAYMDNIQTETRKTPEDFWKLAVKKGFCEAG